jgi:dinuclear metal center YbgI/SA1388 family protein
MREGTLYIYAKKMLTVNDILQTLDSVAPFCYQESYDNSRLLCGDPQQAVTATLLSLDCTEAVVDEAIAKGCNVIVAHHPILFKGIQSLTGKTYVERVLIKAIQHRIALIAVHTNLDNQPAGVNGSIAQRLGLLDCAVLRPMERTLELLYVYVPHASREALEAALFAAGAGSIGHYDQCSFVYPGTGSFRPLSGANPVIGAVGTREFVQEHKVEVVIEQHVRGAVMQALRAAHPYEEIAYGLVPLANKNQTIGAGLIGHLSTPMMPQAFLGMVKESLKTACIRHTALPEKPISRVALCGGSGSFLLSDALKQGADAYISADFTYHQFFDAEGQILIADIGHYESEQFTPEIFYAYLSKKYPKFAFHFSAVNTNPVLYF